MSKHTPGPWEFVPKFTASENHRGFFVRAEKATCNGKWALAEVQPGDEDGKLGKANARLIAAAPDLLEALRALLAVAPYHAPGAAHGVIGAEERHASAIKAARAAIAKAEGKE